MQMNTVKRNQQLNTPVSSKSQGSASVQSCCARNCISTDTALAAVSIFVIAWARFISVRLHPVFRIILPKNQSVRCVC